MHNRWHKQASLALHWLLQTALDNTKLYLQLTADYLHPYAPRVVEIGCGCGYVTCSLALLLQQLNMTCYLVATDINAAALTHTAQTLAAHKVSTALQRELLVPD